MKKTDYSEVAKRYDENRSRQKIERDADLERALRLRFNDGSSDATVFRILDLGCGTGNYLQVQRGYFDTWNPDVSSEEAEPGDARTIKIEWYGIDASHAMLDRARVKLMAEGFEEQGREEPADNSAVPFFDLREGDALDLPYHDDMFDFITCNFAFHHFSDKERALDEIKRVLTPNGTFKIWNIQPELMEGWWVYRYFPEARLEDGERFWREERLFHQLERRGFTVRIRTSRTLKRRRLDHILEDIERRDISELANLADADYRLGKAAVEALLEASKREDTRRSAAIVDEFSQIILTAVKSGV